MKGKGSILSVIGALLVLSLGLRQAAADDGTPRKQVKVFLFVVDFPRPTTFKVGYHGSARLRAECPAFWDSDGNAQGHGAWGYEDATIVNGSLPPGLTFNAQPGEIEGTPQQPGEWHISIQFTALYCHTNDNREVDIEKSTPPNQTYEYNVDVADDAPRSVD